MFDTKTALRKAQILYLKSFYRWLREEKSYDLPDAAASLAEEYTRECVESAVASIADLFGPSEIPDDSIPMEDPTQEE